VSDMTYDVLHWTLNIQPTNQPIVVCCLWYSLCLHGISCLVLLQVSSVAKMGDGDKVSVVTNTGTINDVDCLLWAIGRSPNIESLRLDRVVSLSYCTLHLKK